MPGQSLELPIEGMTCASCASRVERRLNELEGVEASVNYATERASVRVADGAVAPDALVAAVAEAGYAARLPDPEQATEVAGRRGRDPLRARLVVAGILSLAVVAVSLLAPMDSRGWGVVALGLATPVATWCAWPFHRAAARNARHGAATMDTLISIGVSAAWTWSVVAVLRGEGELYFEVAAVVTAFLLAGRSFEARARRRAGAALEALLALGAKDVAVLDRETGHERRVPVASLAVGDVFVVRPGEKVATDGQVVEGASAVDRSLLTGESVPVEVGPGEPVTGATVNAGGRLVVRATRVGADTALAQIARLVTAAQSGKAPVQRLADRISAVFVPVVLVLAALTVTGWLVAGEGAEAALEAGVAVLIIACPCALGLATPTALLVGTGRGAQLGILIRGPEVLEATRRIDSVLLDKTGTLTSGRMRLVEVETVDGLERGAALRLVGAVETGSEHPVGRAIAAAAVGSEPAAGPAIAAAATGSEHAVWSDTAGTGSGHPEEGAAEVAVAEAPPGVTDFAAHAGLGVSGVVEGRRIVAGRPALLASSGLLVPPALTAARETAEADGRTAVLAGWDGMARALLVVADTPRPEAAEAVTTLRDLGLRPTLVTGDNAATARSVAAAVGIEDVVAEVLPGEKADVVARLQGEGRRVAMIGDGVNDAPALARADLGISLGSGADVALEASDLTLVTGDLRSAATAVRLARRTYGTIRANLFWAFAYNVAALPLAALGLLSPLVAGGAMALSSVCVVTNSLRLRRFRAR